VNSQRSMRNGVQTGDEWDQPPQSLFDLFLLGS
jgi:hypothetical protein